MNLNKFDTLIFDLDNTLYQQSSNFFIQVEQRMNLFLTENLSLSYQDASALRKEYYHTYNTTLKGLMLHHPHVCPHEFLDYVSDVPLHDLKPDPTLFNSLAPLKQRKIIFTNGSTNHAKRILEHLGISNLFEAIVSIETTNFTPKPNIDAYEVLCSTHNIDPITSLYFEDLSENLLPGAEMGMTTVLIKNDCPKAMKYADHHGIHHQTTSVSDFLNLI